MSRAVIGLLLAAVVFAMPGLAGAQATQSSVPLGTVVPDGKPHKFETKGKQFLVDGQPTVIIAGEMHFGRVLPEDFEARVKQAKAMGLNTLSFYLFWNLVEKEEGKFDFTGMNDVRRMLKLCQENGLWVTLRPGPYCCAEVDYGGIPWWTCKYPEVKIRTNDPRYVEWSKRYIAAVYREVADLQVSKGGPLVMVQMENEFGMVAAGNYDYMHTLNKMFKEVGFEVPLYVCDPGSFSGRGGVNPYGEDVLRGRNGLTTTAQYNQTAAVIGDFPVYSPEVYTAWFSGWGQPIATRNSTVQSIVNTTNVLLDNKASWCYYMFFGGTNWDYNTGCNEWLPVQTSYDYNAPIDEAGRTTEKYRALREVLAKRTGRTLSEPPADPVVMTLPEIKLTQAEPLIGMLPPAATKSGPKLLSMEELGQAYGFVLYRTTIPNGLKGKLHLENVRDYAITMVNQEVVGRSFVGYGPQSFDIDVNKEGPVSLDILVHNLGRISVITNATSQDRARKGLGDVLLDGKSLSGEGVQWQMYALPLATPPQSPATFLQGGVTFYRGTFSVEKAVSTFLDMRNWGMGVVWVNGHNLGRYWDRGGLRSLFLSEHFLKGGENEVVVMELHGIPKAAVIGSSTKIIEEAAVPFALRLDQRVPAPATQAGRGRGQ